MLVTIFLSRTHLVTASNQFKILKSGNGKWRYGGKLRIYVVVWESGKQTQTATWLDFELIAIGMIITYTQLDGNGNLVDNRYIWTIFVII